MGKSCIFFFDNRKHLQDYDFFLDETFRAQGLGLEGEAEERLAAGRVLPLDPEAGTPMWEKLAVCF